MLTLDRLGERKVSEPTNKKKSGGTRDGPLGSAERCMAHEKHTMLQRRTHAANHPIIPASDYDMFYA